MSAPSLTPLEKPTHALRSAGLKAVFIKNYGCQMNVYDATRMYDVLNQKGYVRAETPGEADLVILNTCHIREKATEKLFSELGRLRLVQKTLATVRPERPLRLAVGGCVAQAEGEEIQKRAPYVDLVFGPQTYHLLPRLLQSLDAQEGKKVTFIEFPPESKFDYLPEETCDKGPVSFLSVQEGCDKFCTYCVVPYTRGVEESRPLEAVLREAQKLVEGGARELVLLGQNVSAYHGLGADGREYGLGDLMRLLEERLKDKGLCRLRYTTSHPRDTQDDLIDAHQNLSLLMPFLHLPVQSGSNKILKAMNRQHPRQQYLETIARFRKAQPNIAFSSDFIVGFPGETEEDFAQTLDLVQEVGFAQAYSFKYSPRPGTPSAIWPDQVPEDVKSQRLHRLQALLNAQQLAFNQSFEGKELEVLIERPGHQTGQWMGRSPFMQSVHITQKGLVPGDLVQVKILKGLANTLQGDVLGKRAVSSYAA